MDKMTELFKSFMATYLAETKKITWNEQKIEKVLHSGKKSTYELDKEWSRMLMRSLQKTACVIKYTTDSTKIYYAITKPNKKSFLIVLFNIDNEPIYYTFKKIKVNGGLRDILKDDEDILEVLAASFIPILSENKRFRLPIVTGALTFEKID